MILGPDFVQRLAASDRDTWKRLVAHAATSDACSPETVESLLAVDDLDGWLRRLFTAYNGLAPDEGIDADEVFGRWLSAGILRAFPADDRRALECRYRAALNDASADAAPHTRALVLAAERAHGARDLLGRAWLLLARQLSEDLDQAAAISASLAAEEVFATIGDESWRAQAVRMRGAALLRAGRIDEALTVLDTVGDAPSTSFAGAGTHRYEGVVLGREGRYEPERTLDPVDAVLYRAGAVAMWAPRTHSSWLLALGEIASATGHRECARRAEAGRDEVLDEDAALPRQMR